MICNNADSGLRCSEQATVSLEETRIEYNIGFGFECESGSRGEISKCHFVMNQEGVVRKEPGCVLVCSGNTAEVVSLTKRNIPGFKIHIYAASKQNTE